MRLAGIGISSKWQGCCGRFLIAASKNIRCVHVLEVAPRLQEDALPRRKPAIGSAPGPQVNAAMCVQPTQNRAIPSSQDVPCAERCPERRALADFQHFPSMQIGLDHACGRNHSPVATNHRYHPAQQSWIKIEVSAANEQDFLPREGGSAY